MTVALAKLGDDAVELVPGSGGAVTVPVRFIGGIPAQRANGPLVLLSGMWVNLPEETGMDGRPRKVRAVAVEVERDGFRDAGETVSSFRGTVITSEGGRYQVGPRGTMEYVRREWIRFALADGVFAGVARMR